MDSEDKFWLGFFVIIGTVVVSVCVIVSMHMQHYNEKVVKEILSTGVSPLEVVCAFDDHFGDNPTCVLLASNLKTGEK